VINSCGTFYSEVSGWETGKWRITGQKKGLRSFGVWRHLVWDVCISVSEQSDTSIFMVKEFVFWDATKCGLVEKYGRFEGSFDIDLLGSDAV